MSESATLFNELHDVRSPWSPRITVLMSLESTPAMPRFFKAVGIMNLLFGAVLLLCGGGGLWLIVPFLAENSPFRLDPVETNNIVAEMRRQLIEDARRDEKNAPDAASKESARKAREDYEATPESLQGKVDFEKVNAGLPWLSRYLWADVISGPILNLLMIGSGLVLILGKPWGKRLAIAVFLLKIIRLTALSLFLGFVVVPGVVSALTEIGGTEFGRIVLRQTIDSRNANGVPTAQIEADEFIQICAAIGYIHAVMSLALGAIYPVVGLILLTRKSKPSELAGQ